VRRELELQRGRNGRPEGSVRGPGDAEPIRFVGTIQLLRVLEELADWRPHDEWHSDYAGQ